nr:MAG TPA: hypothetical protein [Caudoviricetes sp.]
MANRCNAPCPAEQFENFISVGLIYVLASLSLLCHLKNLLNSLC